MSKIDCVVQENIARGYHFMRSCEERYIITVIGSNEWLSEGSYPSNRTV